MNILREKRHNLEAIIQTLYVKPLRNIWKCLPKQIDIASLERDLANKCWLTVNLWKKK